MRKLLLSVVWIYIKYGKHPRVKKNSITKIRKK